MNSTTKFYRKALKHEAINYCSLRYREPGATTKDAKNNWKMACDEWKKEFRKDNKEVISMNCGKSECGGEAGNRTCKSTATYKIKTQVN